jgi:hypothetical protein
MRGAFGGKVLAALCGAAIWLAGLTGQAVADEHPVVVELFTSQGCSSCPPADRFMQDLAKRDDVIALALHVDYWDYIGWKDSFGRPENTRRQKAYARAMGERMVYTPQMVIGGATHVVGTKPMQVADVIAAQRGTDSGVTLSVARTGSGLTIAASAAAQLTPPAVVQLVRYTPSATVDIQRGENAGRRLSYSNIVTEMRVVGNWDGRSALQLSEPLTGDQPVVVLIQRDGHGAILAAARLR